MLARKIIVSSALATVLFAGLPKTGKSDALDSGIFGVVRNQQQHIQQMQGYADQSLKELAADHDQDPKRLREQVDRQERMLSEIKNRCVLAFDPESETPVALPWLAIDLKSATGEGSCSDEKRFPYGFMKMLAAVPCSEDGSFRLALAPGRYAVFVGQPPGSPFSLGYGGWWQYVDVTPHQWLHMVPPKDKWPPTPCKTDADCVNVSSNVTQCRPAQTRQGLAHVCLLRMRNRPPSYDSGVRGRIGAPQSACYGNPPGPPALLPDERYESGRYQCIEAFQEGSTEMAACGTCRLGAGDFVLPLAPGRYVLEIGQESRTVEVAPGTWSELYLQGAKPGYPQYPPCPNMQ
jgi:hypothetical protein